MLLNVTRLQVDERRAAMISGLREWEQQWHSGCKQQLQQQQMGTNAATAAPITSKKGAKSAWLGDAKQLLAAPSPAAPGTITAPLPCTAATMAAAAPAPAAGPWTPSNSSKPSNSSSSSSSGNTHTSTGMGAAASASRLQLGQRLTELKQGMDELTERYAGEGGEVYMLSVN